MAKYTFIFGNKGKMKFFFFFFISNTIIRENVN